MKGKCRSIIRTLLMSTSSTPPTSIRSSRSGPVLGRESISQHFGELYSIRPGGVTFASLNFRQSIPNWRFLEDNLLTNQLKKLIKRMLRSLLKVIQG
jgi:hypothetical protein